METQINDMIKNMQAHAKLIMQGVDARTALEAVYGKEISDFAYRQLSEIENQKFEPNIKNN